MNHLEEAKDCIKCANKADDIESCQLHMDDAKTFALIAIAESQAKIAHDNASFLLVLDRQLGKIAEQLEKMNKPKSYLVRRFEDQSLYEILEDK